ncbi:MAG TPA: tetraacyldisaccharide 4'-kinase [Gemmatimonadaceae bacterium]|nr:tetraacyldisaccharide 4'-kinase [Gemmatimonadaceae bacterium]
MSDRGFVERLWYGDDAIASLTRAVLTPFERLFGGVVGARDILYDAGWLPAVETTIPAVSVGNLTVGGTGKTPMAAWIARGLATRGAHPAVILRGYGGDETLVHERLNPGIPVIAAADRVAGVVEAAARGADIAVLDDAFQHRRVQRLSDLVLISADRWSSDLRLLPAGPWREPLKAVRRATLVIVTRKAASDHAIELVHQRLSQIAPAVPRVSVRLAAGDLIRADNAQETRLLDSIDGATVRVILSIADPAAFIAQLEQRGARVRASVFSDHHPFTAAEVEQLAAGFTDSEWVICTLKDAVKLAPHWPRLAPPLWYVSQQVMVERGVGGLERVLDDLVRARPKTSPTAG